MGKIVVTEFASMDGVVEAPGGDEDYKHAGWTDGISSGDEGNKFKYEEHVGLFRLSKVLPLGASFPYDLGFVPSTRADDGDALDVLVLMDAPAFTGCLVTVRMLGVIEAEQTEKGKTVRNDRLIAAVETHHPDFVRRMETNRNGVQADRYGSD